MALHNSIPVHLHHLCANVFDSEQHRLSVYLRDAANILSFVESNVEQGKEEEKYVIMKIGDAYSPDHNKPVVAKTRRYEIEKEERGEEYYKSIIWPIRLDWHFSAIKEKLQKIKQTPWDEKKEVVVWRGSCTGVNGRDTSTGFARLVFVEKHKDNKNNGIDVAFKGTCAHSSDKIQWSSDIQIKVDRSFYRYPIDMEKLLQYKYLLSLEGNDVSTGLKWMLASNSVVFMPPPTAVSFTMESKLVPYVHYVPVRSDGSDLLSQLEWAKKNDDKCKWISEQATKYIENLWSSDQAQKDLILIKHALGKMYHEKFSKALAVCHSGCPADKVCSGRTPNRLDKDLQRVLSHNNFKNKDNFGSGYILEKRREEKRSEGNGGKEEVSKCKKAALILFGVPSHFQYIWKSYMKYIVQRNPQLRFEVYMHMYSDLHQQPFSSSRSAVRNAKLESPDDVWEILRKGSVPAGITTSSQSTFDESELSWLQQSDTIGFWDYPFQTLQNMFRQGNSLRESLLYLQDQKKHSNDIDVYIFARSDTMLLTPIDIPCSGIGGNEIWVPSWGSWSGINDRFAIAGPNAAKVYASRIEGYKEAMLARRSNPKALPPFNNSEMLHKNWLLKNLLNVTQMGDEWAKLSRVRADGRMHHSDHPSHIATLLNGTVRLDANGNLINVHVAAVAEK